MTPRLDVSVLICTRDRRALLEDGLDAVLRCAPPPAEIVVVDHSGDAGSREAVRARSGAAVPVRYGHGIGTGLSRARNQGIAECTGAVIAFTDDDCLVDPAWVGSLTAPITSGRAEAVVGRTLPERGTGDREETTSYYAPNGSPVFSRRTHPWRLGGGGNFAATREALARAGAYDERFGPGAPLESAEDMDMIHRLLRAGERIVYAPDAAVVHRSWRSAAENRRLSRAYGIGTGGYFTKHALAGDWISAWRFAARFGIRSIHLAQALGRGDRRGLTEQAAYLAGLFQGAARFLRIEAGGQGSVHALKRDAA